MSVYKRVICPVCKKDTELRNEKEKLKKIICRGCEKLCIITPYNAVYYIDYSLPNGRRKREMIGPDRKLAENVLYKRRVEIAEGKFLDIDKKDDIKFEDFSDEYLNVHSKQHKKSWKTDFHIIKILKRFFKGQYLYEITPQDIEHFKIERQKETVGTKKKNNPRTISNATINRELDTLSVILSKAVIWGKLKVNPMKSVPSFKVSPGRLRFLEKEEITKLISNCNEDLRPIIILALFTGMRRSEILELKWHDIDIKRRIITLLDTKNGDKREVPINDLVEDALIGVRKYPGSAYIFCNEHGKPVHDIRKSFSTALRKSGIKYGSPDGVTLHTLRHTFASQLVMAGENLTCVKELLGHKDISMTLRYSHLASSHKQYAVDVLGERIGAGLTLSKKSVKSDNSEMSQVIEKQLV